MYSLASPPFPLQNIKFLSDGARLISLLMLNLKMKPGLGGGRDVAAHKQRVPGRGRRPPRSWPSSTLLDACRLCLLFGLRVTQQQERIRPASH